MSTIKINHNIAIIGAGWLGQPLASHFSNQGYNVTASSTKIDKSQQLQAQGIHSVVASLAQQAEGDWQSLLSGKDAAICLLPPNHGNHTNTVGYEQQINLLVEQLKKFAVRKLIFISSTSVYQKTDNLLNEDSPLNPSASVYAAEQIALTANNIETTVIRFSGLINADRNPTRTLSRRSSEGHVYNAALTPVNLIHQRDCIAIIEQVLLQDCWGQVFNACSDVHLSRQEFYQRSAAILTIPMPQFSELDSQANCIISNTKLKHELGYTFQYNDIEQLTLK